jgi:hypothetical protein
MRFLKIFIVINIIFLGQVWADCYVVTGVDREEEKEEPVFSRFRPQDGEETVNFKNHKCLAVKSWKKLSEIIKDKKNTNIQKILVLQATHGGKGGISGSDDGNETPSEIYEMMKSISNTHKLGVINLSCYSGDILARKLLDDAHETSTKSIDNLCLITSSSFGRPAIGAGDIHDLIYNFNPNREHSLLEFFLKSEDMLASATPWDQEPLIEALTRMYFEDGISKLAELNVAPREMLCQDESLEQSCSLGVNYLGRFLKWSSVLPVDKTFMEYVPEEYRYWLDYRKLNSCPNSLILLMDEIALKNKKISDIEVNILFNLNRLVASKRAGLQFNIIFNLWSKAFLKERPQRSELDERRYKACLNF